MTRSSPNVDILEDSSHKLNFFMTLGRFGVHFAGYLPSRTPLGRQREGRRHPVGSRVEIVLGLCEFVHSRNCIFCRKIGILQKNEFWLIIFSFGLLYWLFNPSVLMSLVMIIPLLLATISSK